MAQTIHETIRCPVTNHRLLDGYWVANVVDLVIKCKCGRLVRINTDYSTTIIQEQRRYQEANHPLAREA